MTKDTVRPFCIANIVNNVYFNGKEVYPISVTEKKTFCSYITLSFLI